MGSFLVGAFCGLDGGAGVEAAEVGVMEGTMEGMVEGAVSTNWDGYCTVFVLYLHCTGALGIA